MFLSDYARIHGKSMCKLAEKRTFQHTVLKQGSIRKYFLRRTVPQQILVRHHTDPLKIIYNKLHVVCDRDHGLALVMQYCILFQIVLRYTSDL